MRVVLMGSKEDGYGCLQHLLHQGHEVAAVVTVPDLPPEKRWFRSLVPLAEEKSIPLYIPVSAKDPEFIRAIVSLQPDIVFSVNFDKIIPPEILRAAKYSINFHGGRLPEYSGCLSGIWAMIKGEQENAVTAHLMEAEADTGDIVGVKKVSITPEDTGRILYEKTMRAAVELFGELLPQIAAGTLQRQKQDLTGRKYYSRKLPWGGMIDWQKSAEEIHRFIRAMNFPPYPPAKTSYQGKDISIWASVPLSQDSSPHLPHDFSPHSSTTTPGTIVQVGKEGVQVATGAGQIILTQIEQNVSFLLGEKMGTMEAPA